MSCIIRIKFLIDILDKFMKTINIIMLYYQNIALFVTHRTKVVRNLSCALCNV